MRSPGLRIIRRVLKPAVHLLALLPFGLLLWGFYNNTLGVNPVESMTFTTGDWGFRLLLITLSVTPLAKITASPWLVHFRRMLGLYCFFYALMHFSIYLVFDLSLDFAFLVEDIVERPYITVGFSCFVVLSSLAVTSPMGIRRKMKDKWQKLHRLVYLAGTLAFFHFLWVTRVEDFEPLVYGAILAVLLGYRRMTRTSPRTFRRWQPGR